MNLALSNFFLPSLAFFSGSLLWALAAVNGLPDNCLLILHYTIVQGVPNFTTANLYKLEGEKGKPSSVILLMKVQKEKGTYREHAKNMQKMG